MERRELRSLLMDNCIWRVALPVLLALAITFAALSDWVEARDPGQAVDFASGYWDEGTYAALAAVEVSECFARGGGEDFYFLADHDGYLYIAVLDEQTYLDAAEALGGGAESVSLAGMTFTTPDDVRRIVCARFDSVPYRDFADYFGPVYLDCSLTPYWETVGLLSTLFLACVLGTMGALLLWLRRRMTVAGSLTRVARRGLLSAALAELSGATADMRCGPLVVTAGFLCCPRRGLLYPRDELSRFGLRSRGRRLVLAADTPSGRRSLAPVKRRDAARCKQLLSASPAPHAGQEIGLFETPSYWNLPGEGC